MNNLGWPEYVPAPPRARAGLPQIAGHYELTRVEDGAKVWAMLDPRMMWHYIDARGRNRSVNFFNAHERLKP